MEKEENSVKGAYDNVVYSVGATVVISLILFSSWVTNFLPRGVLISMGLFFSLPLFFNFIFGIIFNKPNFSVRRKYGFVVYMIIALVLFYYFSPPESVTHSFKLFVQFLAGFTISMISGLLYVAPYTLFRRYSYRIKALVSLGISFTLTYAMLFTLKYFGVISWLN